MDSVKPQHALQARKARLETLLNSCFSTGFVRRPGTNRKRNPMVVNFTVGSTEAICWTQRGRPVAARQRVLVYSPKKEEKRRNRCDDFHASRRQVTAQHGCNPHKQLPKNSSRRSHARRHEGGIDGGMFKRGMNQRSRREVTEVGDSCPENRKEGKLAGGSLVGKDDRAARKLKRMKKRMFRKGRRK